MKNLLKCLFFVALTGTAGTAIARVTFYETPDFGGRALAVNGVVPDFRAYDFNDRAMSAVVEGAPVEVCVHIHFGGNCQVFHPGHYPHLGIWSHQISSVRPAYHQQRYQQRGHDPRRYDYEHDGHRGDGGYRGGYDERARWGRDWRHGQRDNYRRDY